MTDTKASEIRPDLQSLVDAANAEKARQARESRANREEHTPESVDVSQDTPQVDTREVSQRITEISHELAFLEKQLKAGDKNAAHELAILLTEQQQLQDSMIRTSQATYRDTGLANLLYKVIGRPLERLFGKMMAPDNQPLEALRYMALQEWTNQRKADGKSNFLNIPATLKAMMSMRTSPQELANRITQSQIKRR